jgi:hypothetical protein
MDVSLLDEPCRANQFTLGDTIMFTLLEWLLDLSIAVGSAAATGSILMLLLESGKVTCRHVVQHRRVKAAWRINGNAAN